MERFDHFSAGQDAPSASPEEAPAPPITNGHSTNEATAKPTVEHTAQPPVILPTTAPAAAKAKPQPSSSPAATPPKREEDEESDPVDRSPPKKKRKADAVDADAAYAARLQAQENLLARPTRGGNTRKTAPVKKKKSPSKKAKTSAKVRASDDSDIDSSEAGEKKVNRNTGFHVSIAFLKVWVPTDMDRNLSPYQRPFQHFSEERHSCLDHRL